MKNLRLKTLKEISKEEKEKNIHHELFKNTKNKNYKLIEEINKL